MGAKLTNKIDKNVNIRAKINFSEYSYRQIKHNRLVLYTLLVQKDLSRYYRQMFFTHIKIPVGLLY